ncbi:4-hydroxy-3-methylbut-2-enyl diphosphate reductase [Candidatus Woesearchaeota archaeon]|nr:4-hydroxy-3-methylbut-2-enyl diphosphate reductase [Candidatus Woesearchaeota archaeon]
MLETILLANPLGFCAGVERAILTVEETLKKHGGPVYLNNEIVHNADVTDSLAQKGAVVVGSLSEVPAGSRMIFSAHGVPPSLREYAERRGLITNDATCPLVEKVHREALRYAGEGYAIILVGHREHVEIQGTMGEAPAATYVVGNVQEAEGINVPDPSKAVCLTQTTLSVDDTKEIVDVLKRRFPELVLPPHDDICYATQNRQDAVRDMVRNGAKLVLVVGSGNSSNTARLVEVAKGRGVEAYRIDNRTEIQPQWLEGVSVLGLTAGASAPRRLVDGVITHLSEMYPAVKVTKMSAVGMPEENIRFALPRI